MSEAIERFLTALVFSVQHADRDELPEVIIDAFEVLGKIIESCPEDDDASHELIVILGFIQSNLKSILRLENPLVGAVALRSVALGVMASKGLFGEINV